LGLFQNKTWEEIFRFVLSLLVTLICEGVYAYKKVMAYFFSQVEGLFYKVDNLNNILEALFG
jgi:hypothetical protein